MPNADVAAKLRVLSRVLQGSLAKHNVTLSAADALSAVLDLPTLGLLDQCSSGCEQGCKESCKDGCQTSKK